MTLSRLCAVLVLATSLAVPGSGRAAPAAAGTDPANDVVNPILGFQAPDPLRYSQPPADILRWSIQADGSAITASVTMNGLLRDYYEQAAWATVPAVMMLFESETLDQCVGCAAPVRNQSRVALYYRTNPCPGNHAPTSSLVQYEPALMQPVLEVGGGVPYTLSDGGRTVTWRLPYQFNGATVLRRGDRLDNISVHSVTETAMAAYMGTQFCALATSQDGTVDWAPEQAWDPMAREVRPTGISIEG